LSKEIAAMRLNHKRVVILGGTSGIGLATAEAAAHEGAEVVVASSRKARLDRDLAHEEGIRSLFETVGPLDHLVFTAGESLALGELAATSLEDARRFFEVRYWGAVAAVKYAAPRIRRGGSIVLSSGMAGHRPRKGWTIAASVCGAMESLTRALAVELAPLRVNLVCPGLVKTELWDSMPEADRQVMYERAGRSLPVGRAGEAGDLAQAYLYLMCCGFSTGQVVVVDGGAAVG
jgi:NAD(P)-dependent dehydrogenase (short-subunit alcohol dehydrogenase family)